MCNPSGIPDSGWKVFKEWWDFGGFWWIPGSGVQVEEIQERFLLGTLWDSAFGYF